MITRQFNQTVPQDLSTSSVRSENLYVSVHSTFNSNTAEHTEEVTIHRSTTEINQNTPPVYGFGIAHLPMTDFAADFEGNTRIHSEETSFYQKAWEDDYEIKVESRKTDVERQTRRSDFRLHVLIVFALLCIFVTWIYLLTTALQQKVNGTPVQQQTIHDRKVIEVQNELKGIERSEGRQASIDAARRMRDETEDEAVTDACDSWIRDKKAAA